MLVDKASSLCYSLVEYMSELLSSESESLSEPEPEPESSGLYVLSEINLQEANESLKGQEAKQQTIAGIVELVRYRVALQSSEKSTSLFRREAELSDPFGIVRLNEYDFSHPYSNMSAVAKKFYEEELRGYVASVGVYRLTEADSLGWVEALEDNYLIKSGENDSLTIGSLRYDPETGEDVYSEVSEAEAVRLLEVLRSLSGGD